MKKIRILTFSTLYPDSIRPRHGIFVETRLRHLLANGNVESKVVAPVPWFPVAFGPYAKFAQVPKVEKRHNINIFHPRFPLIPKIGMSITPLLMAIFLYPVLKKIIKNGYDFDLIDAHYFYPDGVAAVLLGKWFGKPLTITARGSDLNILPEYRLPKKMIQWAGNQANALITVSSNLKKILVTLEIPEKKIKTLRNGVDLELFYPAENRKQLKTKLNIKSTTLISIGNLVKSKGHDLVIRALQLCPDTNLLIIGSGKEENSLKRLVSKLKLSNRVSFIGVLPQAQLRDYYAAADILILASETEGCPNVLLEAMACGTPVIATNIDGITEIIKSNDTGILVEREYTKISAAINQLLLNYPDRKKTRLYAEDFSWRPTTIGQEELFNKII